MQENQNLKKEIPLSFFAVIFYSVWIFTCIFFIIHSIIASYSFDENSSSSSYSYSSTDCNVSGILVRWYVDTYGWYSYWDDEEDSQEQTITSADDVLYAISEAQNNENIKAVLVEIDSYGWNPVAAEEIATALKDLEKRSYAHIRSAWASAAYWLATGTDKIFASKNSDIWSIWVSMSYLDASEYNKKEGYNYQQLSSGKFKDSWSPDKILEEEEKALFQRDIDIMAKNFIDQVAINREIPVEDVEILADGSTMLGEAALNAQLIDEIWVMTQVHKKIESDIWEELSICWN